MSARATANKGLAAEIRKGAEYHAEMVRQGKAVEQLASQLAPRGESGQTARRFVTVLEGETVRVGNTDPFFHLTEFGSINNPAYAPLRRGVLGSGLTLIDL